MDWRTGASAGKSMESRRQGGSSGLIRITISVALASLALGIGAVPTLAYGAPLPCGARTQSPVFSPWGDTASYFQVSNGGFENGSTDWALAGGAQVVSGNETYMVGGAGDSHSLRLSPNSSAESRTFCVAAGEEIIRMFVANTHVSGAILHVDVTVRNPTTGALGYTAFDVNGDVQSPAWAPTMQLHIPKMFGGNGTEEVTLNFTLRGTSATWGIDDVYVDPFKSW
jgi:hypothetical protein